MTKGGRSGCLSYVLCHSQIDAQSTESIDRDSSQPWTLESSSSNRRGASADTSRQTTFTSAWRLICEPLDLPCAHWHLADSVLVSKRNHLSTDVFALDVPIGGGCKSRLPR